MAITENSKIRDFRIVKKVSEDLWGEVYSAEDIVLQRKIFIRVLASRFEHDDDLINLLFEEVNRQAEISNPNILSLQSFFREKNEYYLVTDYSDGTNLRELMDKEKVFQEQKALIIVSQILNAFIEAHKYGIYHLALNPRYIYVSSTDSVKVANFGFGSLLEKRLSVINKSNDSLRYRSPEQVLSIDNIDGRADLFSLGVILYEMLTGQSPYHSKTDSDFLLMKEITEGNVTDPRLLQPEMSQQTLSVLNSLLVKDRDKRMATAVECRQQLFSYSNGLDLSVLSMQSATELFVKAKDAFQQQKHDEAAMIFKLILEKEPENALAYYYLGMISLEKSHFPEAQEFLTKALVLQPWNDKVLYYLGLLNYKQERYLAAEDYFQKAIKTNAELSRIYYDGNPYLEKTKEQPHQKQASSFSPQTVHNKQGNSFMIWFVIFIIAAIAGYAFWHHIRDKNDLFFSTNQTIPQDVTDSLKQEQNQQTEQETYTLDDAIGYVKEHYLDNYPSMKIGDSINNILTNTNWIASSESANTYYVKVTGSLLDSENHELVEMTFLFVSQKADKIITVQSLLINKIAQDSDQLNGFLKRMYP